MQKIISKYYRSLNVGCTAIGSVDQELLESLTKRIVQEVEKKVGEVVEQRLARLEERLSEVQQLAGKYR